MFNIVTFKKLNKWNIYCISLRMHIQMDQEEVVFTVVGGTTDFLKRFIYTHFHNHIQQKDKHTYHLAGISQDSFHFKTLISWLYTLYIKKNSLIFSENLQKKLLQNASQSLTLIIYPFEHINVFWDFSAPPKVKFCITPYHPLAYEQICAFFNSTIKEEKKETFSFYLTKKQKKKTLAFFKKKLFFRSIYDPQELEKFFEEDSPLYSALCLFELTSIENKLNIKRRYKQLAKQFHPDKLLVDDREKLQLHTHKMQEINHAYKIIMEHVTLFNEKKA